MAGAIVQTKNAQGGGASSTTITSGQLASDVTAGNRLWVVASADNAPTMTPSKNAGTATIGSFVSKGTAQNATLLNGIEHWECEITGTGTLDILVTFGSSQVERVIYVAEISGVNAAQSGAANANNNDPTDTLTVNVTTQPAFGLIFVVDLQGTSLTSGGVTPAESGWTQHERIDWSATVSEGVCQKKAITSTGNRTGNFDNNSFDHYCQCMIVFTDGGAFDGLRLFANGTFLCSEFLEVA
jgi:hypothetical protein